jgi:AraC family transcriptional regulator
MREALDGVGLDQSRVAEELPARGSSEAIGWATSAFTRESGLSISQSNGDVPIAVLSAHAPGDHGISFMKNHLAQGVDASGTSLHHMICLTLATEGSITTRVEHKSETFVPTVGTIALIPEGASCASNGTGAMSSFIVMIPKETLAFATIERGKAGARVVERLSGEDMALLRLGHLLARQVSEGFVDDPLAWYELTDAVVHRLIDAHLSEPVAPSRGRLSPRTLARVIDCIHANIEQPLGANDIADAAQQSWSHFPRLFRRSTGLSPYQYVIKVRLKHAIALLHLTRLSIAEVAVRSGFADQSHLCRWVRRMYGVTPSQFTDRRR